MSAVNYLNKLGQYEYKGESHECYIGERSEVRNKCYSQLISAAMNP